MKQLNTIEISENDIDIDYSECREIFDTYDIIWGGYDAEDEMGWKTTDKELIKKYYDASENFRNFLEEIKQDVSWIDKIIVNWR